MKKRIGFGEAPAGAVSRYAVWTNPVKLPLLQRPAFASLVAASWLVAVLAGVAVMGALIWFTEASTVADAAIAVVVMTPIILLAEKLKPRKATESEIAMLEDHADCDQALVSVQITYRKGYVEGDRGVLWIQNNGVHFNGLRTYFSFTAKDARHVSFGSVPAKIKVVGSDTQFGLEFRSLRSVEDPNGKLGRAVLDRVAEIVSRQLKSDEQAVLPPYQPSDAIL